MVNVSLIVASLPENDLFHKVGHIKIGTKYPSVAKDYFLKRNMDVEIIEIRWLCGTGTYSWLVRWHC